LTRTAHVYFNRSPNLTFDVRVKSFLRYILSDEAQRELVEQGDHLPLSPQMADQQLQQLG
jgi:hypothetical protein